MSENSRKSKVKSQKSDADLLAQINELTEALKRERADSENIRRRHDEQMASLKSMTKANVVRDLLPIVDNFERSLKHVPKTQSRESSLKSQDEKQLRDWIDGVAKIVKQFEKTLQDIGVERIKTVGETFNPELHEVVSMDAGEGGKEVVSEELQSGYKLDNTVIRHAMVRVKTG